MGHRRLPNDDLEMWGWIRKPLPAASEGRDFELLRRSLHMSADVAVASGST